MASVNKVILVGNLGRDPEMRYTPSQQAVTTLSVATTESWMKDGQKQTLTEWHKVVVWGKQAENCSKYLKKGSSVYIEGKIQTEAYEKEGQKVYTTKIVAQTIQFLSASPASTSASTQASGVAQNSVFPRATNPFDDYQNSMLERSKNPNDDNFVPF